MFDSSLFLPPVPVPICLFLKEVDSFKPSRNCFRSNSEISNVSMGMGENDGDGKIEIQVLRCLYIRALKTHVAKTLIDQKQNRITFQQ